MARFSPLNLYNLLIKKWARPSEKSKAWRGIGQSKKTETRSFLIRKLLNSTVENRAVSQAALPGSIAKSSYDRAYKDGKFGGPSYTHQWILALLGVKPGKRLLDIGCGQGLLLREAQGKGLKTFGIDISEEATGIARENSPDSEIICDDAERLPWEDGFFDYITNIGSLEHFVNPEKCLTEMRRTLKSTGEAAVMLPNLYYYRYLLDKFFKRKSPTSYQPIERFAKRKVWRNLLERNGFKVERIHKYNKFNRAKFEIWMRQVLIPLDFSHHFVFICVKKLSAIR